MEDSFSSRPVVGRLIALDLRPMRPLTFLGPAWAAFCGAVASGGLIFKSQWLLVLILSLLLCDVLLGAWRALWLHADWRTALRRNAASTQSWLYFSDETPSPFFARLSRQAARRIAYARHVIWPLIDSDIIGMLIAGILALSIAVVLGQLPFALTAAAMIFGLVEGEVGTERGAGLRALVELAFPWLIAQSAFGSFSWLALVFVLLFTLVYRALLALAEERRGRWSVWNNLAQLGVVLLLISSNAPVGAGIAALGLLAQVLWQARYRLDRDGQAYAQRVQSYILVAMLVAGISLWF
jgi:hypothetical protein